jgi:hypothetical protein
MCFGHGKLTTQRFAIKTQTYEDGGGGGGGGIGGEREGSWTYFLKSEMEQSTFPLLRSNHNNNIPPLLSLSFGREIAYSRI